jgi:hypothetical protein
MLARSRAWKAANPDAVRMQWRMRRARKLSAIPPWFGELDELVMIEAHDLAKLREAATGIRWEIDHSIPLAAKEACGLHVGANIQVIPAAMNRAKRNRVVMTEPGDWLHYGQ